MCTTCYTFFATAERLKRHNGSEKNVPCRKRKKELTEQKYKALASRLLKAAIEMNKNGHTVALDLPRDEPDKGANHQGGSGSGKA